MTGVEHAGQASPLPQSINQLPPPVQKRVLEASVRQHHKQLTDALLKNPADYWRPLQDLLAVTCTDFSFKYQVLNVQKLFLQNCQTRDGIERLVTALGLLYKYANNLLKQDSERPPQWREIYLANETFRRSVDNVEGSRDILVQLGYELVQPDNTRLRVEKEPDRTLVARVTADILLLKAELDKYNQRIHPQQQQFSQYLQHLCHTATITTSSNAQHNMSPLSPPSGMPLHSQATPPRNITFAPENTGDGRVTPNLSSPCSPLDGSVCDICGEMAVSWTCALCNNMILCDGCDSRWHHKFDRRDHVRQPVSVAAGDTNTWVGTSSSHRVLEQLQPGTMPPPSGPRTLPFGTMPHISETKPMPPSTMSHMSGPRTMPFGTMSPTSGPTTMPLGTMSRPRTTPSDTMPPPSGLTTMLVDVTSPMSGPRTMPVGTMSPTSGPTTMPLGTMSRPRTTPSDTMPPPSGLTTMLVDVTSPMSGPRTMPVGITSPSSGLRTMPTSSPVPPPMSEPHTMPYMIDPRTTPADAIPPMSGPRTMPVSTMPPMSVPMTMPPVTRYWPMPPPTSEPHTLPYMTDHRTMPTGATSPMSGPTTMPTGPMQPMPGSSTSYMLQYSALPERKHANEQKKYLLMLKDQYRHVDRNQRETVTQLQKLNLELFSLIRSNQNFMLTSKLDSLKSDISEVETKKADLEKEKAELIMKLKTFLPSSDVTDNRDLSVSSGSPSPLAENSQNRSLLTRPGDTLRPKVHVSLSPLLLGLSLDLPVHVSPSVYGTPSPLLKPASPPMQGSKSPVLLTHPRDVGSQVSPSVLTHKPDMCIPVSPQRPSVLTPPPNVSPGPGTSPVNNSSGNSVPRKVELSVGPKEPRKLPPENDVKAKENSDVSNPARSPHRKSNTLTQRPLVGAVGVTSSAAPSCITSNAAASQAGTTGGLVNGGDVAGHEAQTVGAETGGAETRGAETRGAKTGGATNKGGAAFRGAAPQASGDSAATGGTNGSEVASGDALNNATTSEMKTSGSASAHSTGATGTATRGAKHSSTGVTGGAKQSSAGATAAPEATVPVQRGGQKLKDFLAAIHWQKEEEQRKIRELKEARGDPLEDITPPHRVSPTNSNKDPVKYIMDLLSSSYGISKQLSIVEVKEILKNCQGHVNRAVNQCREACTTKLTLLQAGGVFSETEALTALRQCKGHLEEAQKRVVENIVKRSDWDEERCRRMLRDRDLNRERKVRLLLTDGHLQRVDQADTVLQILDKDSLEGDIKLADILEAVRNCNSLSRSISYLQQECQLCSSLVSASQIRSLFLCQCKFCIDCFMQYLKFSVENKLIKDFVCPICEEPDTDNIDLAERHFECMDMLIRQQLSTELYSLFESKLTDWHLMRDPNFRWCSQSGCMAGFIGDPTELMMECPTCHQGTCFQCKKPWAAQHEGITCEEYQAWVEANDPEHQQAGLARHLEDNGIDCPGCNYRYSLAKGGCMHFKCSQCGHEFCSGCLKPFKRGSNCKVLSTCQGAGLHCHHPRDCLFYLRDFSVTELQTLLNDHSVTFDTLPPSGSDCSLTCQVMEQKEMPNGLQDTPCQRPVPANYAGLCEVHYKEYLVSLINKNSIDPVVIMNPQYLKTVLSRSGKSPPQKARRESGEHYRRKLIEQIKQLLPLPARRGSSASSAS